MKIKYKDKILTGCYDKIILQYIANGFTYKEIRKETGYSFYLIHNCVKNLYKKFNATNHVSLIYKALNEKYFKFEQIFPSIKFK